MQEFGDSSPTNVNMSTTRLAIEIPMKQMRLYLHHIIILVHGRQGGEIHI